MRERDTCQTIISRDDGQEINLYPDIPYTKVAFMMPVEGEDMRKQVFKPVNELDPKELEYFLSLKSTEFRVGDSKDKINDQDTLLDNYLSEIARAKLHYDKMWFDNNKGKGPVILSDPKDRNSFPNYVPANDPKKIESYLRQLDKNSQGAINNAQINYQTDPNDPLSIN